MSSPYAKLRPEQELAVIQYLQICKSGSLLETPKPTDHPKISVIIPMFNEEKNITLLLRTIQNQTFKDFEIVCVDDHSTDCTLYILKTYQKEDPRITIIHNPLNRGVLYSRIFGALHSKGDYILYADADDAFCHNKAFENIYKEMKEKKTEIIHFQSCGGLYKGGLNFETPCLFFTFCPFTLEKIITQPELRDNYLARKRNITGSAYIFDKLYSRKLIEKIANKIGEPFWQQHLIFVDDFLFAFTAMREAESFCMINEMAYWHWIENSDSVTSNFFGIDGNNLKCPEKTNKKILDYILIKEKMFEMVENDPNACELMLGIVKDMEKEGYYDILPRSVHFERFLAIYKKFINWKYSTEDARKKAIEGVHKFLKKKIDLKTKYMELFTDDDEDSLIVERNTKVFEETKLKFFEENKKNKEVIKYEFSDVE